MEDLLGVSQLKRGRTASSETSPNYHPSLLMGFKGRCVRKVWIQVSIKEVLLLPFKVVQSLTLTSPGVQNQWWPDFCLYWVTTQFVSGQEWQKLAGLIVACCRIWFILSQSQLTFVVEVEQGLTSHTFKHITHVGDGLTFVKGFYKGLVLFWDYICDAVTAKAWLVLFHFYGIYVFALIF